MPHQPSVITCLGVFFLSYPSLCIWFAAAFFLLHCAKLVVFKHACVLFISLEMSPGMPSCGFFQLFGAYPLIFEQAFLFCPCVPTCVVVWRGHSRAFLTSLCALLSYWLPPEMLPIGGFHIGCLCLLCHSPSSASKVGSKYTQQMDWIDPPLYAPNNKSGG